MGASSYFRVPASAKNDLSYFTNAKTTYNSTPRSSNTTSPAPQRTMTSFTNSGGSRAGVETRTETTPIYDNVLDEENYNAFVEQKQQEFNQSVSNKKSEIEGVAQAKINQRTVNYQGREKFLQGLEAKDRSFANKRFAVEKNQQEAIVAQANREIEDYHDKEFAKVKKEVEDAKPRFVSRRVTGYRTTTYRTTTQPQSVGSAPVNEEQFVARVSEAQVRAPFAPTQKGLEAQQEYDKQVQQNKQVKNVEMQKTMTNLLNTPSKVNEIKIPQDSKTHYFIPVTIPITQSIETPKISADTPRGIKINENEIKYGTPNPFIVGVEKTREAVIDSGLVRKNPVGTQVVNVLFDVPRAIADVGEFGGKLIMHDSFRRQVGSQLVEGGKEFVRNPIGSTGAFVKANVDELVTRPGYFAGSVVAFNQVGKIVGGAVNKVAKGTVNLGKKFSYVGAKEIPISKIVPEEVLTGKNLFSTSKLHPSQMVKGVESSKYIPKELGIKKGVVHTTDYGFIPGLERTINVGPGRGLTKKLDVPGLYTSTKGSSLYFARLKGKPTIKPKVKWSILPTKEGIMSSIRNIFEGPKIFYIESKIGRIPKDFMTSLKKAQSFFGKTPESVKSGKVSKTLGDVGTPYISPAYEAGFSKNLGKIAKSEAEAVIQVNSVLPRTGLNNWVEKLRGFKYYTTTPEGVRIPIYTQKRNVGVPKVTNTGASSFSNRIKNVVNKSSLGNYSSNMATNVSHKSVINLSNSFGLLATGIKNSSSKSNELSSSNFYVPSNFVSSSKPIVIKSSQPSVVSSSKGSNVGSSFVSSSSYSTLNYSYPTQSVSSVKPSPSFVLSSNLSNLSDSSAGTFSSNYSNYSYPVRSGSFVFPKFVESQRRHKKQSVVDRSPKKKRLFDVYSKRKGKKIVIGKNLEYGQAIRTGSSFTQSNLSRSFALSGKGGVAPFYPSLARFRRPAKKSKLNELGDLVFVQRSKFALSSVGEKKEIQKARLRKKQLF